MFMSSRDFINLAIEYVYELAKEGLDPTDKVEFTKNNVYVVSHSFILLNQKAMLSTTLSDGKYYEVTYNEKTGEIYVDQYVRIQQRIHTCHNIDKD